MRYFVDSGSSLSLVCLKFVKSLGLFHSLKPSNVTLTSFTRNNIPVYGTCELPVTIAGLTTIYNFVVTGFLDTEFLIGLNFMRDKRVTLDMGNGLLTTPSGSTPFYEKPPNVERTMKIRCKSTVTIPPNTVQYVRGKLPKSSKGRYQGMTDPYRNLACKTGLLTAAGLVYSDEGVLPMRCINTTDEPVTVYRNTLMGFLEPIDTGVQISDVKARFQNEITSVSAVSDEPEEKWTRKELFDSLKLENLQVKLSHAELDRLKEIVWKNRRVFSYDESDLGCCNMYEAHIELKEGYTPSWTPSRPVPYKLQGEMDAHIEAMLKADVIEHATEPSNFNSPIFLVSKKGSSRSRFVVDLRGVNKQCMEDNFQLTNIGHVLDRIGENTIFSTFDFSQSFFQVPVTKESRHINAFMHKDQQYFFKRTVMGHKTSSAKFTRMMAKLLHNIPIKDLTYYVDDLMIPSKNTDEHLDAIDLLLDRLASANLRLRPRKTELLKREIEYVGITVSADGVRINEDRVEAVKKLPRPRNRKETHKVVGFFNYNRKFVKNYAAIMKPIYALLKKDKRFKWGKEEQEAFDAVKEKICAGVTLCNPDVDDPLESYEVTLDGSKHGYGATLTQMIRGERRTVAFFSKAVPPHKRQWGQTKLEFETMVAALLHWKRFLVSTTFKVITDCKSLLNLERIFSKTDPLMVRRFQALASFRFTIEHISGEKNHVADFLSRYPFADWEGG